MIFKIMARSNSPRAIEKYIKNTEKTRESLTVTYGVSPQNFADDMIETQELYGKTTGRRYYHAILSSSPNEQVTPQQMRDYAYSFCKKTFSKKGYEFALAVHTNTDKLHAHIVVNAVNARTGKKLHMQHKDLLSMRQTINELSQEHGLTKLPQKSKRNRSNGEYWLEKRGVDSFKKELCDVIDVVKKQAASYDDFKLILARDWEIKVTRDNGKGMTYLHPNGQKVRGKKLGPAYDKPALLAAYQHLEVHKQENTVTEEKHHQRIIRRRKMERRGQSYLR